MAMLSIGLAGAVATLVLLGHSLWSFQRLGHSAMLALAAKDAIADALPPPLFLIEVRVLASQAVEGTVDLPTARQSAQRLEAAYEERLQYWRSSDSNTLPELVLQHQGETARRLISRVRHDVFEPLAAGNRGAALQGLAGVNEAYVQHRQAVEEAVAAGRQAAAAASADFEATRHAGERLMPALALVLLGASYLCYRRARRGILRPLRECVTLADRVAAGDFGDFEVAERKDEIGRLQRALRDMTGKLARMREELVHSRDAAESAARAKASFLANMSHEVRTPMNAILGLTHLVQRTALNGRQRDYVCKVEESAQSLLRIINDILDFSKIDAGKLELESAPFELDRLAKPSATRSRHICSTVGQLPSALLQIVPRVFGPSWRCAGPSIICNAIGPST
jgi:signal transduction histidine kinase